MPFDIATGTYTDADPVLPLLTSGSGIDATAGRTPVTPVASGPADSGPLQGGVMPTTAMFGEQAAAGTADCAAAMSSAMSARDDMIAHFQGQALPLGGQIGDDLVMPVVPDNALVPASSDQYPWPGDEPVPSSAGPTYQGNVPQ